MIFQRVNRSDPEKLFVIAKSAYTTASLTVGQVVIWAYNGTDDGIAITQPATAKLALIAGVVGGTIANGDYGLIQVYGHNADCIVSGGTTDLAVGTKLAASNASFCALAATNTAWPGQSGVLVAGQAYTTATQVAKKVFIRCL